MAIELYVFPPSPRAFKVMVVANHLGIDGTLRFLDLRKGEQREAGYARLNPNHRMPTLRDGDDVVWESEAILQYLALKNPAGGLLPADARGRLAEAAHCRSPLLVRSCAGTLRSRRCRRGGKRSPKRRR